MVPQLTLVCGLFWASKDVKKSEKGADNGERSDEWERVWKNAMGPTKQQIEVKGTVGGGWRPHFDAQVSKLNIFRWWELANSLKWWLEVEEDLNTLFLCVFVMSMRKIELYCIYIVHPGYPATWYLVMLLLSFWKFSRRFIFMMIFFCL